MWKNAYKIKNMKWIIYKVPYEGMNCDMNEWNTNKMYTSANKQKKERDRKQNLIRI